MTVTITYQRATDPSPNQLDVRQIAALVTQGLTLAPADRDSTGSLSLLTQVKPAPIRAHTDSAATENKWSKIKSRTSPSRSKAIDNSYLGLDTHRLGGLSLSPGAVGLS